MSENGKIPETSETSGHGDAMELLVSYRQNKRTTCERITSILCHALLWTALLAGIFSMARCALS